MVASQLTIRSFYICPFLAFRFLRVHFSLFKAEPKKLTFRKLLANLFLLTDWHQSSGVASSCFELNPRERPL